MRFERVRGGWGRVKGLWEGGRHEDPCGLVGDRCVPFDLVTAYGECWQSFVHQISLPEAFKRLGGSMMVLIVGMPGLDSTPIMLHSATTSS